MSKNTNHSRHARDVEAIAALVEAIRPLLAGHEPAIQSAALAELLSMWLAGHFVTEGATAALRARRTTRFRNQILADHVELVRKLSEIST